MFKIYDLNMKEIPFPDGVMPLEIFVGSIGKERYTDKAEGRNGVVDYGFDYTDRPVSLFLRIKAADKIDFRLLRNEVFATFDIGSAFYVAEADVPSRVLKVVVDESYIPDRLTEEYADFDINCRTLDSVFWESKYTTLELHDSGYSGTAEKYGLVDNIDDEKVQYRFNHESNYRPNIIPLGQSSWEVGNWFTTTGDGGNLQSNIRTRAGQIAVTKGETYTFDDSSLYVSTINRIYILHYDNGNYIHWMSIGRGEGVTFQARGDEVRISLRPLEGFVVRLDFLDSPDNRLKMKLESGNIHSGYILGSHSFNIYNAGNVTVEPESMELYIQLSNAYVGSEITITNTTTGDVFRLNRSIQGSHVVLDRMNVRVGEINTFRDSNRRFINLAPGDNNFEINGATYDSIFFRFKYYYK